MVDAGPLDVLFKGHIRSEVAVVTGAARGIGLSIAKKFLAEGYAVALLDIDATELAKAATTRKATSATQLLESRIVSVPTGGM